MSLICPNCEAKIPAENINIQRLVAVCADCDTVFEFDPPESKVKRRKVKQPEYLMLRDTETLLMTFRTNFRLTNNEGFLSGGIMGVVFTFVTAILISEYLVDDVPLIMPIVFGLVASICYYWLALVAFNTTHIEMNDDAITVSRKPLPNVFEQPQQVNLNGVVAIRCEETPKSKKEAYDLPRYRVWAQMAGESRQLIVNDVTEDYAFFIAQILEERLGAEADVDASRLVDEAQIVESESSANAAMRQSQENA